MGACSYSTVLIGSGNVASHLGLALEQAGHRVVRVGGRSRTMPIPQDADLYVIAVGTNDIRYRNKDTCAMTSEEYLK